MISAKIEATSLDDYYRQLVAAQEKAHGKNYCAHHEVIRQAANDGCEFYAELGVNQGATLACALLAGFGCAFGVDVATAPFWAVEPLFTAWTKHHFAAFAVYERDSLIPFATPVDFLLIDTIHTPEHVREELRIHGPNVRRQILIHDTATHPELQKVAREWADANAGWWVKESSFINVGFTLLEKRQ